MPEIGLGIFRPLYYSPDLLWRWKAGWAGGTFSRASSAWYTGPDGRIYQAAVNVPRIEWYDLDGDGVREAPTTLLEPGATNLLLHSCDLSSSQSAWAGASNFTVSPAASIFAGQTAWRHQNLGLSSLLSRGQTVGTLTGQPETMSAIIENVDATEAALNIRDNTAGVNLCIGRLTWATGQASVQQGTGTVRAQKLADAGPNGGPVYRLMVTATGTAGNQRRIFVYPSGTSQNTQAAIIHHVQHETGPVATSPIVTTTAAVTRSPDVLTFPWPHAPGPYTGYLRFVERGAITRPGENVLLRIGALDPPPRLTVLHNDVFAPGYLVIYRLTTSQAVTASLPASPVPAIGDLVELLWRLYPDGSVRIEQAINGGAPVVAARSAAIGMPSAWSGQVMRLSGIPSGGSPAPAAWRDAVVLRGSDWTWDDLRSLVGA